MGYLSVFPVEKFVFTLQKLSVQTIAKSLRVLWQENQWTHTQEGIKCYSSICGLPESNTGVRIVLENRMEET